MTKRIPAIYIPHGGGPWPFVSRQIGSQAELAQLRTYLEGLYAPLRERLVGVVCITAHFEAEVPTVTTAARPPMLYDYSGFGPESLTIQWPAPGSPALAGRVRTLLSQAGISSGEDGTRGFDHGTFVPLKLADPDALIPTVQLSLQKNLDPEFHLTLGRALAPLREEGILLLGSGSSYHNLRSLGQGDGGPDSAAFHTWLRAALHLPPSERRAALVHWSSAPGARASHPREEHLLPLHVIVGATLDDDEPVSLPFTGSIFGVEVVAVQVGS